jgi:hypothetical protein
MSFYSLLQLSGHPPISLFLQFPKETHAQVYTIHHFPRAFKASSLVTIFGSD